MYLGKVLAVLFLFYVLLCGVTLAKNCNENTSSRSLKDTRYDYVYSNPRRQSLEAWGRYVYSNSKVRYLSSPSRLKRAAHAARIEAYNTQYENY